jgi:hypothetical protein
MLKNTTYRQEGREFGLGRLALGAGLSNALTTWVFIQ